MGTTRPAAVAGSFYPRHPEELRATVTDLLGAAPPSQLDLELRMLIVPHAGYVYSGPIAAVAYAQLKAGPPVGRVVLLGPSHFVRFPGLATVGVAAMETPLGPVAVDPELAELAEAHPDVTPDPVPHAREHSLEVQLPFLQLALADFTVAALVTGDVTGDTAADVLDGLLGGPDVIGVISSDLSHYLGYEEARRRDSRTAAAIMAQEPEAIAFDDACGRTAVQAALRVARRRRWRCTQLALGNSGDSAGSRRRVVGYGAFAIGPRPTR